MEVQVVQVAFMTTATECAYSHTPVFIIGWLISLLDSYLGLMLGTSECDLSELKVLSHITYMRLL